MRDFPLVLLHIRRPVREFFLSDPDRLQLVKSNPVRQVFRIKGSFSPLNMYACYGAPCWMELVVIEALQPRIGQRTGKIPSTDLRGWARLRCGHLRKVVVRIKVGTSSFWHNNPVGAR